MALKEYWAAVGPDKIADEIKSRFDSYKVWMDKSGYGQRIRTTYHRFYSMDKHGTLSIYRDGKDIARIDVNHYRSLLRRIHIMVCENKLSFQPRARNTDTKSQIESDLSRGICDYYNDEKNMNEHISESVLGALVMLEYYVHCPWSIDEGYELTTDGNNIIKSGDQVFENYGPFDVARNTTAKKSPWYIVRTKVNKYDLAAEHGEDPVLVEAILNSSLDKDDTDYLTMQWEKEQFLDEEDYTHKYIFYHKRTASLPTGRWTEICGGKVLRDGELEYERMPVNRITAGDVIQTCFADSPAVDLVGLQEGMNALFSAVTTNALNNAQQLIHSTDPNLTTRKLEDGQTLVTSAAPPTGLNLSNNAADSYKLIDMYVNHQQLLSGVNDAARGNPQASLKSGASIAVVLAQAIQYVSNLQKNYARLASDVGTCLINNIQKFAKEEMIAYISGTTNKGRVKKFKAEDIMNVDRVTIDLGNPLTQTLAGRRELVAEWTANGLATNPKSIMTFMRTGEYDSMSDSPYSDMMLIADENEALKRGENPPCVWLDNHVEHILAHKGVMSSPEAREDVRIIEAVRAHINAHVQEMRMVPPDIAAIISGQPLPPPATGVPGAMPAGGGPQPQIGGAAMPGLPGGTPPQIQNNYDAALAGMPEDQEQLSEVY